MWERINQACERILQFFSTYWRLVYLVFVEIWKRIVGLAKYPIAMTRAGACIVGVFVLLAIAMAERYPYDPPPGVAIGLLGLAAVVMAVRADGLKTPEKVGWIIVAFLLFYVEVKSIQNERDQHEREQNAASQLQLKGFSDIGDGIKAAIRDSDQNFKETMSRSDTILSGLSSSIQFQTGGDSFLYVPIQEPMSLNNGNEFVPVGLPILEGKYPLRDVQAEGHDIETGKTWFLNYGTIYPQNTGELGRARYSPPNLGFSDSHKQPVVTYISLSTSNGSYFEEIQFRTNKDGKWKKAMRVIKTGAKNPKALKSEIDPDYPENPIDWNR